MDKDVIKYRNDLKELFKKYSLHKCIRLPILNSLLDEVNSYYVKNEEKVKNNFISIEEHEAHLNEQLNGWIKHLESEKSKLTNEDEKNGFTKVIEKLKDVAKR